MTDKPTKLSAADEAARISRLPGDEQRKAYENASAEVLALLPKSSAQATAEALAKKLEDEAKAEKRHTFLKTKAPAGSPARLKSGPKLY